MKKILFSLFMFLTITLYGQDETNAYEELSVWGKYSGENLYVLNPSENGTFSVKEVYVDGKALDFCHESNAFEIPLEGHELNSFVYVKIVHLPQTNPLIINEESLIKESEFSLPSFVIAALYRWMEKV